MHKGSHLITLLAHLEQAKQQLGTNKQAAASEGKGASAALLANSRHENTTKQLSVLFIILCTGQEAAVGEAKKKAAACKGKGGYAALLAN